MGQNLEAIWALGYSIAELWGASRPVNRGTSAVAADHLILWGILGIVEYQVDRGAGHKYLRERLWRKDWVAIGYSAQDEHRRSLVRVPPIADAKFGKTDSAIGDGSNTYLAVRVVNSELLDLRKFQFETPLDQT